MAPQQKPGVASNLVQNVAANLIANAILYVGGVFAAALLGIVVLLVRGLQPWQEFTIAALFAFLLVMLGAAIYRGNKPVRSLAALPPPEDDALPLPFLDPTHEYTLEERELARLQNEFEQLSWSQQGALAMLHNFTGAEAGVLKHLLTQRGFGLDIDDTIIRPLLRSSFVELSQGGRINPHPARLSAIARLVKMWRRRGI